MNELTCRDCGNCYLPTLICQHFNKSVADNSVHTWECEQFVPRKPHVMLEFHVPPTMECHGVSKNKGKYYIHLGKRKVAELEVKK